MVRVARMMGLGFVVVFVLCVLLGWLGVPGIDVGWMGIG